VTANESELRKRGLRVLVLAIPVGLVAGLATWLFLTVFHVAEKYLWETLPAQFGTVPHWAVNVCVIAICSVLLAAITAVWGRPVDTGRVEAEYEADGRIEWRSLPAVAAFSWLSLLSGAAIGPEAPLEDINGGLGTLIAEKTGVDAAGVRVLAYAGVAGAFGAFFGVAPVGALLAIELMSLKAEFIDRTMLVAGLVSAAAASATYFAIGGHSMGQLFAFTDVTTPHVRDLALAVGLGIVGGAVGLVYGLAFKRTRVGLTRLRANPWAGALAGGVVLAGAAIASPYLLFSGQTQLTPMMENASALGLWMLIGLAIAKLALSIWSLSTTYFGGPIFPLFFAGAAIGFALNLALPWIPVSIAVVCVMASLASVAAPVPLSVTLLLGLLVDPRLIPVISIAAVVGYIIRRAAVSAPPSVEA
jgi:H+/Cl- antiporter ClcA